MRTSTIFFLTFVFGLLFFSLSGSARDRFLCHHVPTAIVKNEQATNSYIIASTREKMDLVKFVLKTLGYRQLADYIREVHVKEPNGSIRSIVIRKEAKESDEAYFLAKASAKLKCIKSPVSLVTEKIAAKSLVCESNNLLPYVRGLNNYCNPKQMHNIEVYAELLANLADEFPRGKKATDLQRIRECALARKVIQSVAEFYQLSHRISQCNQCFTEAVAQEASRAERMQTEPNAEARSFALSLKNERVNNLIRVLVKTEQDYYRIADYCEL